jgi:hypothetical protein
VKIKVERAKMSSDKITTRYNLTSQLINNESLSNINDKHNDKNNTSKNAQ